MRVSLEWLREFVDVTAPDDEVAHRLTMAGFEVEGVERIEGDQVFEVNVTPNRPDCLSVIGLARELSALYETPLRFPELDFAAESKELDFNLDIFDPDLCHRYAGRVVRNLTIGASPAWMRNRLEKCGIRSINNVVDVTNYVLLELGHPLHAFDLDTLKGRRIRIGTPGTLLGQGRVNSMATLDGVEREIPTDSLLIWDLERPVAVAGVMGGLDTEVKETTKDIFIESAYFEPRSVRRTSKTLGLKTESSYRFERGTDIKMLKKALDRAAYLVREVAGGTIYGKIDVYPRRYYAPVVTVRHEKLNRVLGLSLPGSEIARCLRRLGLETEEHDDSVTVKTPTFRRDLTRDVDLIEEVARVYGYERIPAELPAVPVGSRGRATRAREVLQRELKESLLKSGFTEAINYSFMGTADLDLLRIAGDDNRRRLVPIKNPLRIEDSFMRTTLVPGLFRNLFHNLAHGNRDLRLFEVSKVFIARRGESLPEEREHVALLAYREKTKALYRDETPDFYLLKGLVEAILGNLRVGDVSCVRSSEPFLHPGQSADVVIGGNTVGFFGVLSPVVAESLDLKAQKPSVLVMELDLGGLAPFLGQQARYRALPKYPFIERDIAAVVESSLDASALVGWLRSYGSDLIEEISIFDVYQGGSIPAGKKSLAFRVRYRATDRTLTDDEIEAVHRGLVAHLLEKSGGQLRQ